MLLRVTTMDTRCGGHCGHCMLNSQHFHSWHCAHLRSTLFWSRIFMRVFFVWVLADFALLPSISFSMIIHHLVCASGTAMALFWSSRHPDTAMHFLRGSIVLEFGSAVTNLACLYPILTPFLPLVLAFTHAIAIACAVQWCHHARSPFIVGIVMSIVVCLCAGRQWTAYVVY